MKTVGGRFYRQPVCRKKVLKDKRYSITYSSLLLEYVQLLRLRGSRGDMNGAL